MSAVADRIGESVLKRARVASTEDAQGVVHTEITGPLGVRLLSMNTWRGSDKKIRCELAGPLKGKFAGQVEAFMAVINRLKIIAEKNG